MIILQASEFIDSGDGQYRTHEPGRFLGKLKDVISIDCSPRHRLFSKLSKEADILIIPFYHRGDFFPLIEMRRPLGKATVFETNDYYLDMQPWNPIAKLWYNPDIQAEHLEYLRCCDAVQTSTKRLASHWRDTARRVAVFPNQLSTISPISRVPSRPLTIGWGGSQGHLADWYAFSPAFQEWLESNPNVHLSVMSHQLAKDFIKIPKERYSFFEADSLEEYYKFLSSLDIGLAPLLPTEYNRCRSDVKFLEYASHGVVGLYANLEPYRESVEHGSTGFLFETSKDCIETLDLLLKDKSLLESVRTNAYNYVRENRLLSAHIEERLEFYRTLLKYDPSKNSCPNELLNELRKAKYKDGNYFRLELGEVETKIQDLLTSESSNEAVSILTSIVEEAPDYICTYEVLGKMLNDLKRPKDSISILEKGLKLEPQDVRLLSELGRTHFLLGDESSSRVYLERAITIDPLYLPGWFYLLNFMRVKPQSDASTIIARALLKNPKNFSLSFLIARLYEPTLGLRYLKETLKRMGAELSDLELQESQNISVQAIIGIPKSFQRSPEYLEVLKVGVSIYPYSARLAHLLGLAYREIGDLDGSFKEFQRAFELSKIARHFKDEFRDGDETHYYWEITNELIKANC